MLKLRVPLFISSGHSCESLNKTFARCFLISLYYMYITNKLFPKNFLCFFVFLVSGLLLLLFMFTIYTCCSPLLFLPIKNDLFFRNLEANLCLQPTVSEIWLSTLANVFSSAGISRSVPCYQFSFFHLI